MREEIHEGRPVLTMSALMCIRGCDFYLEQKCTADECPHGGRIMSRETIFEGRK